MFAVEHGLDLLLVLAELVALELHVQNCPGGGVSGVRAGEEDVEVYLSWAVTRCELEAFPMFVVFCFCLAGRGDGGLGGVVVPGSCL